MRAAGMKRAFTLVELITTIVIMAILSAGAYVSLAKLFSRSASSRAVSQLSLESRRICNQISALLRERIPATVIGYDSNTGDFASIYTLSTTYPVLEWIGGDFDEFRAGRYSGFIDLERCDRDSNMLYSPATEINATGRALLFSGTYDEGEVVYDSGEFNTSWGWHGNSARRIYALTAASTGTALYTDHTPDTVYEKYILTKSAYALARYPDIDSGATCIQDLNLSGALGAHTLFLFYDYRPWLGETFCADTGSGTKSGKVTVLTTEASGFEAGFSDGALRFSLTLERTVRSPGKDHNITVSKEKAVL